MFNHKKSKFLLYPFTDFLKRNKMLIEKVRDTMTLEEKVGLLEL